jgi:hypothetical protein
VRLALEAIDYATTVRPSGMIVHDKARAPHANVSLRHDGIAKGRGLVSVAYRKTVSVNGHRIPRIGEIKGAWVLRPRELGEKPESCRYGHCKNETGQSFNPSERPKHPATTHRLRRDLDRHGSPHQARWHSGQLDVAIGSKSDGVMGVVAKEKLLLCLHRLCGELDRLGRRCVDFFDQRLDRGAGHRPHVEIGGARIGEKIRILHRGVEG